MKALLKHLAEQGDIDWLSFYFARFISEQANRDIDDLLGISAALVSEANQNGDVCIDLEDLQHKNLFSSTGIDDIEIPRGIGSSEWADLLLTSPVVGRADAQTPLTLDGSRLYLHRYWHYENEVAKSIRTRLGHLLPDRSRPDQLLTCSHH